MGERSASGYATVTAVQHVKRMRGGAQSHLMRGSNNKFYVVKFRNNPQGVRILANEFIFSNLAKTLDLSVPIAAIVDVSEELVQNTPALNIWIPPNVAILCDSGLQYGSEYATDVLTGRVTDQMSPGMLTKTRNLAEFAGMLVLDKWACNVDSRQTVFWKKGTQRNYSTCFIDHGYCFGGGEWAFRDEPLRGTFARNEVYGDVTGWSSFDPWLTALEEISNSLIWDAVCDTPPIWYRSDWAALEQLAEELISRRGTIRKMIESFRDSPRRPFPRWGQDTQKTGRKSAAA